MNTKTTFKASSSDDAQSASLIMSEMDFAQLGDGEIAYIKQLSPAEAGRMFPSVKGIPKGIALFSLHAADGTPIALTDTLQAAIGHAEEGELAIAPLH